MNCSILDPIVHNSVSYFDHFSALCRFPLAL